MFLIIGALVVIGVIYLLLKRHESSWYSDVLYCRQANGFS